MEKLMTAKDVAEALKVSEKTAYTYMHQMQHMASPLRVTESEFRAWMMGKMMSPGETKKTRKKKKAEKNGRIIHVAPGPDGKWHVPRVRVV